MTPARKKPARALDWWLTLLLLGYGAGLVVPGQTLVDPGLARLLQAVPQDVWGYVCIAVAVIRLIALFINGHLYESAPIARVLGAAIGASLWAFLAAVHLDVSVRAGAVSPGIWLYACLAACDFQNAMRAARDAVHAGRARRGLGY